MSAMLLNFCLFAICLCLVSGARLQAFKSAEYKTKVHPQIRKLVEQASLQDSASIPVVVYLKDQYDFRGDKQFKQSGMDRNSIGKHIHNNLMKISDKYQQRLLASLPQSKSFVSGVAGVERIRRFSVANAVAMDVKDPQVVALLAKNELVAHVEPNVPFKVALEVRENSDALRLQTDDADVENNSEEVKLDDIIEWNINWINAPYAWNSSFKGEGMVYANADTGVLWQHETLFDNYIGNKPEGVDHNYSWFDAIKGPLTPGIGPCGFDSQEPCDDNSHGSHTTSTAVGAKGVGVAPGARWMACRNMDRGFGSSESYLSCLEFFAAPTDLDGENPRPELRPHAIGNSYGCPKSEGCAVNAFSRAVQNLRAAGIFMSVSAGNEGPSCSTIEAPPAYEPAVISVGATSKESPLITYFSSRGPAFPLGPGKPYIRKPDVTAPGQFVRAASITRFPSNPFNKYAILSGTSMASPHVGGAVLLITQACPCLARDIDRIQDLLQSTAHHYTTGAADTKTPSCGGEASNAIPNNVYGYGGIDVKDAIIQCQTICDGTF